LPRKSSESADYTRTQLIVALIGLVGVLAAALIANWDKLLAPRSQADSNRVVPIIVQSQNPSPFRTLSEACHKPTRFQWRSPLARAGRSECACADGSRTSLVRYRLADFRTNPPPTATSATWRGAVPIRSPISAKESSTSFRSRAASGRPRASDDEFRKGLKIPKTTLRGIDACYVDLVVKPGLRTISILSTHGYLV
jgi:hypothetical protein